MTQLNHYTNDDLYKGINKLARQITNDQFIPSLIVGVLRGGIIPAIYLSHWFGCPIVSVEWSTRDNAVGQIFDDRIFTVMAQNKKVLLVDDICDTGLTLKQIYSTIKKETKLDNIRTAVLHYNIGQKEFVPEYFHLEINKNEHPQWIIYPWEDI